MISGNMARLAGLGVMVVGTFLVGEADAGGWRSRRGGGRGRPVECCERMVHIMTPTLLGGGWIEMNSGAPMVTNVGEFLLLLGKVAQQVFMPKSQFLTAVGQILVTQMI